MDNSKLLNIIKVMIDQVTNDQITELKQEIFNSKYKIIEMEIKLGVAYEELAKTKEHLNEINTYSTESTEGVIAG